MAGPAGSKPGRIRTATSAIPHPRNFGTVHAINPAALAAASHHSDHANACQRLLPASSRCNSNGSQPCPIQPNAANKASAHAMRNRQSSGVGRRRRTPSARRIISAPGNTNTKVLNHPAPATPLAPGRENGHGNSQSPSSHSPHIAELPSVISTATNASAAGGW